MLEVLDAVLVNLKTYPVLLIELPLFEANDSVTILGLAASKDSLGTLESSQSLTANVNESKEEPR